MIPDFSIQLAPLWPTAVLLGFAGALFAAVLYATIALLRKHVRAGWIALVTGLRLAAVAVFLAFVLQPTLTMSRTVEPLPEMLVLVDTSRSMATAAEPGQGSRLDKALAACRAGDFATALRDRYHLDWYAFDRTARPVPEGGGTGLQPAGGTTHLADSLTAAYDHARAMGKYPDRLLLISDGNDRGTADPAEAARRLGLAVDVLPPVLPPGAFTDAVEIADVQSSRRVLLGSETHFRLRLRSAAPAGHDREVSIGLTENGKPLGRQTLVLKAGQIEQTFGLVHRPDSAGLKHYEFQPPAEVPGVAGRPYRLNVQVTDSKFEALILEDTWRWEYRYLHRLFEDDPSFRFTAFLARGPGTYVQFGSPDQRVNLIGFPQGRADLEGYDTFFVGDVNPARWSRGLAAALAQLVTEEGKSLVVIAGPNLTRLAAVPELHALLPVELTQESGTPVEGPIEVRLRPDAAHSPFFFQLTTGEAEKLPPLDQVYPALRKRPGATVLIEAANHRNAFGNLIVLAEQAVGRGRVLFVGTDTLWKWHTLATATEAATPYTIFWQQACRALAPARSRVRLVNLWLTPSRTQAEVGQAVTVEAELQCDRALPRAAVRATVTLADDKQFPIVFAPDASNPKRFRATFTPPEAGQIRLEAQAVADGETLADATTALQVSEGNSEGADRDVDRAALSRLATVTGGQVIDLARPETWPPAADPMRQTIQQRTPIDLAGNFSLMLLLCGLLGVDWFVRLFKGIV